jgi:O-antigen/teichoic acid export membrane protein
LASTKRRLLANSASGLVERFANLAVQVWLYQYLIKRLSPEEYSLYPAVTALLVFVPPLTVMLTAGISRYSLQAHTEGDAQKITEITSTMAPVLFGAALVLAVSALATARYLEFVLKIATRDLFEARMMLLLLFGSLALRVALVPFSNGLFITQKFVALNSLLVAESILRTALLFVLLFGGGARVLWVAVANVGAAVPMMLITAVWSVRALPALKFRFRAIRWELLSSLMGFGFWNMIGSLGVLIRRSSDLLVLNRFATAVDLNTFHLASITDNQIDSAMGKLLEPMLPVMVARHTTHGATALRNFYLRGTRYSFWLALFIATPLIVFRHVAWSLYLGSRLDMYATVPLVMVLLLARYWIECPLYFIGLAAYAANRVRMMSMLGIATSLFNLAITIYFVHFLQMGAVGSALGTLVAVLLWDPLILWKMGFQLMELKFASWLKDGIGRGTLPSVVAGLVGFGWCQAISVRSVPQLILGTTVVSVVYLLCVLLFCLEKDEYQQLKQIWTRFVRRPDEALFAPPNEL